MSTQPKEHISITRALTELKRIDDRIRQHTAALQLVTVAVGRDAAKRLASGNKLTPTAFEANAKSDFDRVNGLMRKRAELKARIVESNSRTRVTIAGREMTVAEAIEMKSFIALKESLVSRVQMQIMSAESAVATAAAKLDQEIEASLNTIYGSGKTRVDSDTRKQVAEPKLIESEPSVYDPLSMKRELQKFIDEVASVKTEWDWTLNQSNAATFIDVEL